MEVLPCKTGPEVLDISPVTNYPDQQTFVCFRNQQRRYYFSLMKSILVSRLRLLEAASRGSPGTIPRPEKLPMAPPRPSPVHQRVRRRYFQELTAVREELGESSQSSEDENYPGTVGAECFETPGSKALQLPFDFVTTSNQGQLNSQNQRNLIVGFISCFLKPCQLWKGAEQLEILSWHGCDANKYVNNFHFKNILLIFYKNI